MPKSALKGNALDHSDDHVSLEISKLVDTIRADLVASSTATDEGIRPCLQLPKALADVVETDRIVYRSCYEHLQPVVLNALENGVNRLSIEGTPGVGKSVFGYVLLRHLVRDGQTVLFWDKDQATMFSTNAVHIEYFGLNGVAKIDITVNDDGKQIKTVNYAAWGATDQNLKSALIHSEVFVIHDPAEGYLYAGTQGNAMRMIIILSFGHALVSQWARKGLMPVPLIMPCFDYEEIVANHESLFSRNSRKTNRTEWTMGTLKVLHEKFGGSIRHWGIQSEDEAWEELEAKVEELARTNGTGLVSRTPNSRGSVVHVNVDFDKTKPLFPDPNCNKFKGKRYELGSARIAADFFQAFMEQGTQQLRAFMQGVKSEKGVKALYGILFEVHAHKILRDGNRDLKIRVVRRDGKDKNVFAETKLPILPGQLLRFPGREASGLTNVIPQQSSIDGTYIMPESSSFPTYDAAVVVDGPSVGLSAKKVGLLLQMTVSGASSLRRQPEHIVRQYMRKEMHKELAKSISFSMSDPAVTTFCVPDVCFHPFLFQMESKKDEDVEVQSQPEFQFVIEIPDFAVLPRQKFQSTVTVDQIHGASGRTHRYMLRSEQPQKKQKVEEIH